jgi:hypothetical protein
MHHDGFMLAIISRTTMWNETKISTRENNVAMARLQGCRSSCSSVAAWPQKVHEPIESLSRRYFRAGRADVRARDASHAR